MKGDRSSVGSSVNSTGGFTLIELTIVVVILGALFLLAMPKLQDMADVHLKSSSRRLVVNMRYLYNQAIFKKRTFKLNFDLDENFYWVEVLSGNEFVGYSDQIISKQKLQKGIKFKNVITERTFASRLTEREEFILIYPTGRVDPAIIYLESPNGEIYTLETKPFTGRMAVYDEFVEFF